MLYLRKKEEIGVKLAGLQKMTLLDYPGRVACTVFLPGCNFRCPFCHNSPLISESEEGLSLEEFFSFLKKRRGLLDGVCVSGGEPTLQADLPQLLAQIRDLGFLVKLDTNGSRPEVLRQLIDRGLVDYVAMDIKNAPKAYAQTCGLEELDLKNITESIRALLEGRVEYELRTTVSTPLHQEKNMEEMASWLASLGQVRVLYLQNFVDRETVPNRQISPVDRTQMEKFKRIMETKLPRVCIRGEE